MEKVSAKNKESVSAVIATELSRGNIARSITWGVVLFLASLVINYFAGTYATEQAGSAVRDIILDHLPIVDVDGVFTYGIIVFFVFVGFLTIKRPKRAPFILKSLSLFIVIRSFFIILTHIGPAQFAIPISPDNIVSYFTFTGDLFFSAHTGIPFLLALIFWKDRLLRAIFICTSIFFAVVVLLGHLHYSIDVFSAYFITYGIFQMAVRLFKKEFHLSNTVIQYLKF